MKYNIAAQTYNGLICRSYGCSIQSHRDRCSRRTTTTCCRDGISADVCKICGINGWILLRRSKTVWPRPTVGSSVGGGKQLQISAYASCCAKTAAQTQGTHDNIRCRCGSAAITCGDCHRICTRFQDRRCNVLRGRRAVCNTKTISPCPGISAAARSCQGNCSATTYWAVARKCRCCRPYDDCF